VGSGWRGRLHGNRAADATYFQKSAWNDFMEIEPLMRLISKNPHGMILWK
jgi:hypothetical protein